MPKTPRKLAMPTRQKRGFPGWQTLATIHPSKWVRRHGEGKAGSGKRHLKPPLSGVIRRVSALAYDFEQIVW
jgi:hypothetical protein